MAGITKKSFESPDEKRTPDKTKLAIVDLSGTKAARVTFEPGWRWSECIKPAVGTDSCQAHHLGAAVSGRLHIKHEDGTEMEVSAGDAYEVQPGHDAWVVGDESFIAFEFDSSSAEAYAKALK